MVAGTKILLISVHLIALLWFEGGLKASEWPVRKICLIAARAKIESS